MRLRHDRIPLFLERSHEGALRLGAVLTPREALIGGAVVAGVMGMARLGRAAWDCLPRIDLRDLEFLDIEML